MFVEGSAMFLEILKITLKHLHETTFFGFKIIKLYFQNYTYNIFIIHIRMYVYILYNIYIYTYNMIDLLLF